MRSGPAKVGGRVQRGHLPLPQVFQKLLKDAILQSRRHRGGLGGHATSLKRGKQRKKRTIFKAETIERLSPSSKYCCFSHSRVSRIQKFFLSANHGGRQYFSVFHGPSTLKSISPALEINEIL